MSDFTWVIAKGRDFRKWLIAAVEVYKFDGLVTTGASRFDLRRICDILGVHESDLMLPATEFEALFYSIPFALWT